MSDLLFNIEEIDHEKLNLWQGSSFYSMEFYVNTFDEITDEILSWIINPPAIYAAKETDEMKKRMEHHAKVYSQNRESSIRFARLVKKEFYELLCTDSDAYKNERIFKGNINTVITSISAVISTKLGNSIDIVIITSLVTYLTMILAKMSVRIACEYLKPIE